MNLLFFLRDWWWVQEFTGKKRCGNTPNSGWLFPDPEQKPFSFKETIFEVLNQRRITGNQSQLSALAKAGFKVSRKFVFTCRLRSAVGRTPCWWTHTTLHRPTHQGLQTINKFVPAVRGQTLLSSDDRFLVHEFKPLVCSLINTQHL